MSVEHPAHVEGPRLYMLTSSDHGPLVLLASYIGLTLLLLSILARIAIKTTSAKSWAFEDSLIIFATFLSIFHTVTLVESYKYGLGRHSSLLTPDIVRKFGYTLYSASLLYYSAIITAKVSVFIFIQNISSVRVIRKTCQLWAIAILAWGLTTIVVTAFACHAPSFWAYSSGKCINFAVFYRISGLIDIITDVILVILTAYVFSKFPFEGQCRTTIVLVVCTRILVIVPAIHRIQYINPASFNSGVDLSWTMTGFLLYSSAHMNTSIILATVTCVWPFLSRLDSCLSDTKIPQHIALRSNQPDQGSYQSDGLKILNTWTAKLISAKEASLELITRQGRVVRGSTIDSLDQKTDSFDQPFSLSMKEDDRYEDPIKFVKGLRPDFTDYEGIVTGASQFVEGPLRSRSSASWEEETARRGNPEGKMCITKTIGYGVKSQKWSPM